MTEETIAVLVVAGSSHSWTWLADLLYSAGRHDARFVDERHLQEAVEDGCGVVVVSGGDAYRIASSLGDRGFGALRAFIEDGGLYAGVCAGAYLPLPTSVEPMCRFNLSSTKIENIAPLGGLELPDTPRARVGYCDRMIVHPVRGEVTLSTGDTSVEAPLYGGPIFKEPTEDECVARYSGPTPRTEFQVERDRALGMLIDRPAAISTSFGSGRLLLFGPHLEHPSYPSANSAFLELLGVEPAEGVQGRPAGPMDPELHRAVADLRVAVTGLEGRSFVIGEKVWNAERMMTFVDSIMRYGRLVPTRVSSDLAGLIGDARAEVVRVHPGDADAMEGAVDSLMSATRVCVDEAFRSAASGR